MENNDKCYEIRMKKTLYLYDIFLVFCMALILYLYFKYKPTYPYMLYSSISS